MTYWNPKLDFWLKFFLNLKKYDTQELVCEDMIFYTFWLFRSRSKKQHRFELKKKIKKKTNWVKLTLQLYEKKSNKP